MTEATHGGRRDGAGPFFGITKKWEVARLLNAHHYIGSQCADPSFTFVWRRAGGLFGDCGGPCATALFAPPASFAWGRDAIELIRLVRDTSQTPPLTAFMAECFRVLRSRKRYQFVVAYSDPAAGHHGGVYQAGNWLYIGRSSRKVVYIHKESGKRSSQRSFDQSSYANGDWTKSTTCRKYTYIYPLTKKARVLWSTKTLPYPKPSTTQTRWHHSGCTVETGRQSEVNES